MKHIGHSIVGVLLLLASVEVSLLSAVTGGRDEFVLLFEDSGRLECSKQDCKSGKHLVKSIYLSGLPSEGTRDV